MAIVSPTLTLSGAGGVIALYVISRWLRGKGYRPLPPGPKGFPIFGNINDLPKPGEPEWQHWLRHKDLYGAYNYKGSFTMFGKETVAKDKLRANL